MIFQTINLNDKMYEQTGQKTGFVRQQEPDLEASISPVTNLEHPFIRGSNDKEQFSAYQNFVKNIEMQQKMSNPKQDQIHQQFLQLKQKAKLFKAELQAKQKSSDQFRFTQFLETRQLSRNNIKTASCKNMRIHKNQQPKIFRIPSTAKVLNSQKCKKTSPQELKGRPYVQKKPIPKKPLVLKEKKENTTQQPKFFQEIKLKVQKLPELKSEIVTAKKQHIQPLKIEEFKNINAIIKKKKLQKSANNTSENPILKTFDTRYFGIDNKQLNYQKIGKDLLQQIKSKYWCYEDIKNEEVYENFQNFLVSRFIPK